MTETKNRKILLASRPAGEPTEDDFRLAETAVPEPGRGQVLLRTLFLSLDPYMRGRMSDAPSYAPPVEIDAVMVGGTVSEVVASDVDGFAPGDVVEAYAGWQDYALSDGRELRRIDTSLAPVSTALGVLGMPGMTAYTGLANIGQPKAGETVAVAAASGPVGSLVGQLAKQRGCRTVGIAGGAEKCAHVVNDFGFDACVDHRHPDFARNLMEACPKGIDVYFENVGGSVFEAVLPLLNFFARVPVCGLVSQYSMSGTPEGPNRLPGLMRDVLFKRLSIRGFIVTDFADRREAFLAEMGPAVRDGRVRYKEDVVDGLENAPRAFIGLLRGGNFGKLLVRVGADAAGAA